MTVEIIQSIKDNIKDKLINKVKGTVSVYHSYTTDTPDINISISIQNYAHVFHYTIYDIESELYKGTSLDDLVEQIVKQYKFTLFAKFFKTPRNKMVKR